MGRWAKGPQSTNKFALVMLVLAVAAPALAQASARARAARAPARGPFFHVIFKIFQIFRIFKSFQTVLETSTFKNYHPDDSEEPGSETDGLSR